MLSPRGTLPKWAQIALIALFLSSRSLAQPVPNAEGVTAPSNSTLNNASQVSVPAYGPLPPEEQAVPSFVTNTADNPSRGEGGDQNGSEASCQTEQAVSGSGTTRPLAAKCVPTYASEPELEDATVNTRLDSIDDVSVPAGGGGFQAASGDDQVDAPDGQTTGDSGGKDDAVSKGSKEKDTKEPACSGCWVLWRPWPDRECRCIPKQTECDAKDIARAELCTICDYGKQMGYTVFDSFKECQGDSGFVPSDAGIDPGTYPQPDQTPVPMEHSCGWQAASSGSGCPHKQGGLRRWSDSSMWRVPQPQWGNTITVPSGKRVLLSACDLTHGRSYSKIVIPYNSELILNDQSMHLKVGAIEVKGKLSIGSPSCPRRSSLTITFPAGKPGVSSFQRGIIGKPGSKIQIHGRHYRPTWTRLRATISPGQSYADIQADVDWKPGQLIVFTTSIWKDEFSNHNEVKRISSVSTRRIYLTSPFQHYHYGGPEYQVEVGLLSRDILLQGELGDERTKKGPHVRIEGQGTISGVLAYRMGQLNVLGAYPFHFHLLGNAQHSWITHSAVFNSFFRCFVVHGTNQMQVSHNVAFHAQGSCFYLEDGVEEDNVLHHNLAAYVHVIGEPAAGALQKGSTHIQDYKRINPADAAAAGFYVTNANNIFTENAASGGFAGFNFPQLPAPLKDSKWKKMVPEKRPLKKFEGNTAHSSGYMWQRGSCFYIGGRLTHSSNHGGKLLYSSGRVDRNTRDYNGKPASMIFRNIKAFLCQRGINHWGLRVDVLGYEAYDVTRGATLFGDALLSNAYISHKSRNYNSQFPGSKRDLLPVAGFQWYDSRVRTIITNTVFAGFGDYNQKTGVWLSMAHSDEFKPEYISAVKNVTYVNADHRAIILNAPVPTGASRYFNFIDWDGTATRRGNGRPVIVGSYPSWWKLDNTCQWHKDWQVWTCQKTPWRVPARLDIQVPGFTKQVQRGVAVPPTPNNHIGWAARFGPRGSNARKVTITRNEGLTGVSDGGWYVHFSAGATPELLLQVSQLALGTSFMFATRYPSYARFRIYRQFRYFKELDREVKQVWSKQQVQDGDGMQYYFDGHHLYLKIADPGDSSVDPPFIRKGVAVWGKRFYTMWYKISVVNMKCPWRGSSGPFCHMADRWDDIPYHLPDRIRMAKPTCFDERPPGDTHGVECTVAYLTNKCNSFTSRGLCKWTCGSCETCTDFAPTGGSGSCVEEAAKPGQCNKMKDKGQCQMSCGRCWWYKPDLPAKPSKALFFGGSS